MTDGILIVTHWRGDVPSYGYEAYRDGQLVYDQNGYQLQTEAIRRATYYNRAMRCAYTITCKQEEE